MVVGVEREGLRVEMHQRRGDGRYGGAEGCALMRAESARAAERTGAERQNRRWYCTAG